MAEMLLINPRKRRAGAKRARRTTAKRKHNPLTIVSAHAPKRRRRNPIAARAAHRRIRRRRNPISLGVSRSDFISDLKNPTLKNLSQVICSSLTRGGALVEKLQYFTCYGSFSGNEKFNAS